MEPWFQIIITIFSSVLASSGLWAYLSKRTENKDVKTEMLIGLAHDRIMYLGMSYIERGYITQDEYENLKVYLLNHMKNWEVTALLKELCRKSTNCQYINLFKIRRMNTMNMMKLNDKTYDTLKWIAMYLLPAAGTLYFALAGIWGLPYGEQVVGTITAVDTFLGVILGISTAQYNKANKAE